MFSGWSNHTLDAKGRLAIPTRFRDVMKARRDERLVITTSDRCLVCYPNEEWRNVAEKISRLSQVDPRVQAFRRYFISAANECTCDKQGTGSDTPGPARVGRSGRAGSFDRHAGQFRDLGQGPLVRRKGAHPRKFRGSQLFHGRIGGLDGGATPAGDAGRGGGGASALRPRLLCGRHPGRRRGTRPRSSRPRLPKAGSWGWTGTPRPSRKRNAGWSFLGSGRRLSVPPLTGWASSCPAGRPRERTGFSWIWGLAPCNWTGPREVFPSACQALWTCAWGKTDKTPMMFWPKAARPS